MTAYNPAVARVAMSARIRKLPVDERGYPVPKFVSWLDGKPDFRVITAGYWNKAVRLKLCWLCGEPLGRYMSFVIGPMCAINRVTSEPPSHLDCAHFAVQTCPFLTQPRRKRDTSNLPGEATMPAGIMVDRNPGVSLIWVTDSYHTFRPQAGDPRRLIHLGPHTALEWWARGRTATREEVLASIYSGLPQLRDMADQQGPEAAAELTKQIDQGLALVPQ